MDNPADTLKKEFSELLNWEDRYEKLIELGKKLPPYPDSQKTPDYIVEGCTSRVWLKITGDVNKINFLASSDSMLVAGLIYLLFITYNELSAEQVLVTDFSLIKDLGLEKKLSLTRQKGLQAIHSNLKQQALQLLTAA